MCVCTLHLNWRRQFKAQLGTVGAILNANVIANISVHMAFLCANVIALKTFGLLMI